MSYQEVYSCVEKSSQCLDKNDYIEAMSWMETAQYHWSEDLGIAWPDFPESVIERVEFQLKVYLDQTRICILRQGLEEGCRWMAKAWSLWQSWIKRAKLHIPHVITEILEIIRSSFDSHVDEAVRCVSADDFQAGTDQIENAWSILNAWKKYVHISEPKVSAETIKKVDNKIQKHMTSARLNMAYGDYAAAVRSLRSGLALSKVWGKRFDVMRPTLSREQQEELRSTIRSHVSTARRRISAKQFSDASSSMKKAFELSDGCEEELGWEKLSLSENEVGRIKEKIPVYQDKVETSPGDAKLFKILIDVWAFWEEMIARFDPSNEITKAIPEKDNEMIRRMIKIHQVHTGHLILSGKFQEAERLLADTIRFRRNWISRFDIEELRFPAAVIKKLEDQVIMHRERAMMVSYEKGYNNNEMAEACRLYNSWKPYLNMGEPGFSNDDIRKLVKAYLEDGENCFKVGDRDHAEISYKTAWDIWWYRGHGLGIPQPVFPDELYIETFEGTAECPICLDDIERTCAKHLKCGNSFCYLCLKRWLSENSNCPLCRYELPILMTADISS